jgi:hypothetical protein
MKPHVQYNRVLAHCKAPFSSEMLSFFKNKKKKVRVTCGHKLLIRNVHEDILIDIFEAQDFR